MQFSVERSGDKHTVCAQVSGVGPDLLVVITGGRAHIGAVALAQPTVSAVCPEKESASTSVLPVMGHREDVVVQRVGHHLCQRLRTNVVVVAGIHWDDLTPPDIECILGIIDELKEEIARSVLALEAE